MLFLSRERARHLRGVAIGLVLGLTLLLHPPASPSTSPAESRFEAPVYDPFSLHAPDASVEIQPCLPVDPSSGTVVSNLPEGMYDMGAAAVRGKAYLIGGQNRSASLDTVLEFDPVAKATKAVRPLPVAIWLAAAVSLDEKIYVLGGIEGSRATGSAVPTIRVYDPIRNTSHVVGILPEPRFWGGAAAAGTGIYYGGGNDNTGQRSDKIFRFDPASGESVEVARLPQPTAILTATSAFGKVYFIGGNIRKGTDEIGQSNSVLEYDPATNVVKVVAAFPPPRGSDGLEAQTAVTLAGKVYIFNGWDDAATPKARNEIYRFDPLGGRDAVLVGTLPRSVERGAAVAISGRAYLFGGADLEEGWLNAGITEFTPHGTTGRLPPSWIRHGFMAPREVHQAIAGPPWVCPDLVGSRFLSRDRFLERQCLNTECTNIPNGWSRRSR